MTVIPIPENSLGNFQDLYIKFFVEKLKQRKQTESTVVTRGFSTASRALLVVLRLATTRVVLTWGAYSKLEYPKLSFCC